MPGVAFLVLFKFNCRNNVIMVKVTGGYSSVIGSTHLIGTNVDWFFHCSVARWSGGLGDDNNLLPYFGFTGLGWVNCIHP